MWQPYTDEMNELGVAGLVTIVWASALVLRLVLQFVLQTRQNRHVRRWQHAVPKAFTGQITLAAHRKAADYTVALSALALVAAAFDAATLLGWTLLGGLDALNTGLRNLLHDAAPSTASAMAYQVALLVSFSLIGSLLELPLDVVRHFVVEQRFGFNRLTPRLYLLDLLKSTLLGLAIGIPLLLLILWLMGQAGPHWWWWAFAAVAAFQVLLFVVYPTWIAPLFNRFTPLQDEALEARIRALMARCGVEARGLWVMDGSRRSAHANAYFTGLGRHKRVVFYDTLLQRLTPEEIEAVLAHELGHDRRHHIVHRLGFSLLALLGLFGLLGLMAQSPAFYAGLGVQPNLQAPNDGLALALFMLVLPPALYLTTPLAAWWSRRHEYEADAFAADHADAQALARALVKLHEDNASTLTPDPWYARFHYSHPPALERLKAIGVIAAPTPA